MTVADLLYQITSPVPIQIISPANWFHSIPLGIFHTFPAPIPIPSSESKEPNIWPTDFDWFPISFPYLFHQNHPPHPFYHVIFLSIYFPSPNPPNPSIPIPISRHVTVDSKMGSSSAFSAWRHVEHCADSQRDAAAPQLGSQGRPSQATGSGPWHARALLGYTDGMGRGSDKLICMYVCILDR